MYLQLELAGLIVGTQEWDSCQKEKEKGSAADQSNAEPSSHLSK